MGFHIPQIGKFCSILLERVIKHKALISEKKNITALMYLWTVQVFTIQLLEVDFVLCRQIFSMFFLYKYSMHSYVILFFRSFLYINLQHRYYTRKMYNRKTCQYFWNLFFLSCWNMALIQFLCQYSKTCIKIVFISI